jgi:tRNA threonylcarbamoyl adenosine modification protein YeaZ
LAAVDLLMENAGLEPSEVSTIVVSRGPGSFTGIRAGLATASGLRSATGAAVVAYDSLTMLAARCSDEMTVWCAQPGRRGEVYARPFEVGLRQAPVAVGNIEILPVAAAAERGPWVAAASLDLGGAVRAGVERTSSEALLFLHQVGAPQDAIEPLYVEGPPIHQTGNGL